MKSLTFSVLLIITLILPAQNQLELLSHLPVDGASWDIWGYVDETTGKEYALIGANGLTIIDISDELEPKVVGNVPGVAEFDHKVWKHYVYTVTGVGTNRSVGHIIDIKNPESPVLVDSFPSAHNLFIDDQGYMYASNPGVTAYDLNQNPEKPDSLWRVGQEGHDVTVAGDIMYDFHGRSGTFIYDISDRNNPKQLSTILHPDIAYHHQGWPTKDGKHLLICDELAEGDKADISVWNIEDLENPEWVESFGDNSATVHNVFVLGNWAYTSYYAAGVRVFDLTEVDNLILVDEYDTTPDLDEEGFEGVFGIYPLALDHKVLASDRKQGLFVFRFDTTKPPPPVSEIVEVEIASMADQSLNFMIRRGVNSLEDNQFAIRVINADGRLIHRETITLQDVYQGQINTSSYMAGIYIIEVTNPAFTKITRRFFVKN